MDSRRRFDRLVRPVLEDLFRFARRLTGDPVEAEDLLQVALERGLTRLHQLDEDGAFRVWQSRVIYTTWLNERARRSYMWGDPEEVERRVVPLEMATQHPGVRAETRQLGTQLARAFETLPPGQREAVWLVDGQGHTYEETAAILGVAPGTAASRVARGRIALRQVLAAVAAEQGVRQ